MQTIETAYASPPLFQTSSVPALQRRPGMAARGNLPIGENLNLSSPFAVQRVGRSGRSCWPMEGGTMKDSIGNEYGVPAVVDRDTFQAELDALRVREKAHTREGDAIAAARRRLPMVEVDGATPLIGERGAVTLLDAFEGRRMLIAYYFMW